MKLLRAIFTLPVLNIFSVALAVRVIYNAIIARNYFPLHDSLTYENIARNILQNQCYCLFPNLQTVDRAPLWPAIIAALYGFLGDNDRNVRLLLCLVGSATCVLIYFFAKDLFHKRAGFFAGLLAAFYPFLFVYDGWLYAESLFTFLLLAFCYTLYHLQNRPRLSLMILSGVLIGLLALTRPNGITLIVLFILWAVILGRANTLSWRNVIKSSVLVSLVAMLIIAPWAIRNYLVTKSFIPIAVGDGKVLLGAYNDLTADPAHQNGYYLGIWILPDEATPSIAEDFPEDCSGSCEVGRDNTYKYYALQWMRNNLDKMPMMLGLHLINTWQVVPQEADLAFNRFQDGRSSQIIIIMMQVMTPVIFALAALGLFMTRKRWRELLFFYFMIAFTIVQGFLLYSIPRFRAPIEPMLLILAAGAVWWLASYMRKRRIASQKKQASQQPEMVSSPGTL